jgi:hypothetical protein
MKGTRELARGDREAVKDYNPGLKSISAELRETVQRPQDWWGEAPDLPFKGDQGCRGCRICSG